MLQSYWSDIKGTPPPPSIPIARKIWGANCQREYQFYDVVYFKFSEIITYANYDMGIRRPRLHKNSWLGRGCKQHRCSHLYLPLPSLPVSVTAGVVLLETTYLDTLQLSLLCASMRVDRMDNSGLDNVGGCVRESCVVGVGKGGAY